MPEPSEISQAQVDINLLREHVNKKGLLPIIDSLPAASKIIMVVWPEEVDGPYPYLLLLGKLNGRDTYIGLGSSRHKKNHAPPMDLWVDNEGSNSDDETDEEEERFENVDSSQLENIIMVQPFRDCWAGLVKRMETRTPKFALDVQRGGIKGLACWYLLRNAEKMGEGFAVFRTMPNYLVSALGAIAMTRAQSSEDRQKAGQLITTASGSKQSDEDHTGRIETPHLSQSKPQIQQTQLSSVGQQQQKHLERDIEPPGMRQLVSNQTSQEVQPETPANNNNGSPGEQESPIPQDEETTDPTARTSTSQLLPELPGSSTVSRIAADQGFRMLGKAVDDERKLAAQREDLKRQREEIDNRIREMEKEIVAKRVKIRALAVGLPLDIGT